MGVGARGKGPNKSRLSLGAIKVWPKLGGLRCLCSAALPALSAISVPIRRMGLMFMVV